MRCNCDVNKMIDLRMDLSLWESKVQPLYPAAQLKQTIGLGGIRKLFALVTATCYDFYSMDVI